MGYDVEQEFKLRPRTIKIKHKWGGASIRSWKDNSRAKYQWARHLKNKGGDVIGKTSICMGM